MSRPRVTAAERQEAVLQDQDRGRVEILGITSAQRMGARAQRAAYAAFRAGRDPGSAFADVLREEGLELLTQTMVLAHMTGIRRSRLSLQRSAPIAARKVGILSQDFRLAVRAAERKARLTDEEVELLAAQYTPYASKVIATFEATVNRALATTMLRVTVGGEHVRGAKKALAETFHSLGLRPKNSFTLEAIFRTQTAIAYAVGRYETERDPAIQEILWGYRYVTVGDNRVREEHVGFDGVTLPKDDPFWTVNTPPNGWACRCAQISVFEERPEYGPRAVEIDGEMVEPKADDGFAVNFGAIGMAL